MADLVLRLVVVIGYTRLPIINWYMVHCQASALGILWSYPNGGANSELGFIIEYD
jgi:hypothetical protein